MRTLGVLLALLVVACNASPTDPSDSNGTGGATFTLQSGSSTQVASDLRVTFAQVLEDSRCPTSVVCAWQGNGAIRLDVTTRNGTESLRLNTAGGPTFPGEASGAGYTFTLVELDPQKQTGEPIPPQQYRATIRVSRAQ